MVGTEPAVVETALVAGRLSCPACGQGLRPWGHARSRELRRRGGVDRRQPRRAICPGCGTTHVLLPDDSLARRRDAVEVIGAALASKAGGCGHRRIAADLDLPPTTVRGWLRRFGAMADHIREHFTRWAHALDPQLGAISPAGSAFADALEAIGVAARAGVWRFGPHPPWSLASVLSGGGLLANTSSPWAAPG
jgi:Domain of unknown function (DUF6431)